MTYTKPSRPADPGPATFPNRDMRPAQYASLDRQDSIGATCGVWEYPGEWTSSEVFTRLPPPDPSKAWSVLEWCALGLATGVGVAATLTALGAW